MYRICSVFRGTIHSRVFLWCSAFHGLSSLTSLPIDQSRASSRTRTSSSASTTMGARSDLNHERDVLRGVEHTGDTADTSIRGVKAVTQRIADIIQYSVVTTIKPAPQQAVPRRLETKVTLAYTLLPPELGRTQSCVRSRRPDRRGGSEGRFDS